VFWIDLVERISVCVVDVEVAGSIHVKTSTKYALAHYWANVSAATVGGNPIGIDPH
jgi:hypothetical protein